jgi:predicted phosphodiesterase
LHGKLPLINPCDLLIIAGDITPGGDIRKQALFLDTTFRYYFENIQARNIIYIAGNHDTIFQKAPELVPQDLKATYLQDSMVEIFGFKVYGTPWQLPFYGAFNASEQQLKSMYDKIPSCDMLISGCVEKFTSQIGQKT